MHVRIQWGLACLFIRGLRVEVNWQEILVAPPNLKVMSFDRFASSVVVFNYAHVPMNLRMRTSVLIEWLRSKVYKKDWI